MMSDTPAPNADRDAWRAMATQDLKGADPDTLIWQTPEGIAVHPLYTAADTATIPTDGLPGAAPFRRGVRATMYTGRAWTIRQYAGFSTFSSSLRDFISLLSNFFSGPSPYILHLKGNP